MRRMMHAAVLFALLTSSVHAQNSKVKPLPVFPASEQSIRVAPQAEISQWKDAKESLAHTVGTHPGAAGVAPNHVTQPNEPNSSASDSGASISVPFGYDSPYSQLATYMSCNNVSPCLWHNYANERAAIAACVMRHVDGQCSCFNGQCKLHSHSCSASCGQGGGQSGCTVAKVNRYREPISTFYDSPSSVCGKTGCNTLGKSKQTCQPACTSIGNCSALFSYPKGDAFSTGTNLYGVASSPSMQAYPDANSGRFASPSFGNAPIETRMHR